MRIDGSEGCAAASFPTVPRSPPRVVSRPGDTHHPLNKKMSDIRLTLGNVGYILFSVKGT